MFNKERPSFSFPRRSTINNVRDESWLLLMLLFFFYGMQRRHRRLGKFNLQGVFSRIIGKVCSRHVASTAEVNAFSVQRDRIKSKLPKKSIRSDTHVKHINAQFRIFTMWCFARRLSLVCRLFENWNSFKVSLESAKLLLLPFDVCRNVAKNVLQKHSHESNECCCFSCSFAASERISIGYLIRNILSN